MRVVVVDYGELGCHPTDRLLLHGEAGIAAQDFVKVGTLANSEQSAAVDAAE